MAGRPPPRALRRRRRRATRRRAPAAAPTAGRRGPKAFSRYGSRRCRHPLPTAPHYRPLSSARCPPPQPPPWTLAQPPGRARPRLAPWRPRKQPSWPRAACCPRRRRPLGPLDPLFRRPSAPQPPRLGAAAAAVATYLLGHHFTDAARGQVLLPLPTLQPPATSLTTPALPLRQPCPAASAAGRCGCSRCRLPPSPTGTCAGCRRGRQGATRTPAPGCPPLLLPFSPVAITAG